MAWTSTMNRPFGRRGRGAAVRPVWRQRGARRGAPPPADAEWEPWEAAEIAFEGAAVLEDMAATAGDAAAVARVTARFVALQFVLRAAAGDADRAALEEERAMALGYAALVRPAKGREAAALRVMIRLAGSGGPPPALPRAIRVAGHAAVHQGHGMGALSLYNTSYNLALGAGQMEEAAASAAALGRIVRLRGHKRAAALWQRRAVVLRRWAAERRAGEGGAKGGTGS